VAAALIHQLESIGRSCGCPTVMLHTVRETGNVEIFERLGFLVESEEPTNLFQSETCSALSEVVMRKDLIQDKRPAGPRAAQKSSDRERPPNDYQASPRQGRRSSPSGRRPKPKRRQSR
jgi:hypothetical protein